MFWAGAPKNAYLIRYRILDDQNSMMFFSRETLLKSHNH